MDDNLLNEEYRSQLSSYLTHARKSRKVTVGALAVLTLFIANSEHVTIFLGRMYTWLTVIFISVMVIVGLLLERLYDAIESTIDASRSRPVVQTGSEEYEAVRFELVLRTEPIGDKIARRRLGKLVSDSPAASAKSWWKHTMFLVRVVSELWRIQSLLAFLVLAMILLAMFSLAGPREHLLGAQPTPRASPVSP